MERKSLAEISWQVSESEYRQDPALSQSNLGAYDRLGFSGLDQLFDKIESPSLAFGSMVDCWITDGSQAFNERYFVSDIPSIEPAMEPIVKEVFNQFKNSYTNLNDIPDAELMPIISQYGYQPRWKPETRCKVVREKGQQYYQTMYMAKDKTVVPQETYNKVFACVTALKESPQTRMYFQEDNPFENIERYYQLKFKETFDGVPYRGMADLLIVLHDKQVVIPCDLKTSSKKEYDFFKSFIEFRYSFQARLYWKLIRRAMDRDPYYRNFKLADFRFIVVNTTGTPNPLVWEFDKTQADGDITVGKYILKDPLKIGKELYNYLTEKPSVPDGIEVNGLNSITKWLETQ